MTDRSCARHDDAAAWVLGMLPVIESQEFRVHLNDCALCQAEVVRLEEATDSLALLPDPGPPAPELRERLLAGVEAETALLRSAVERPIPGPPAPVRRARRAAVGALAAAALVGVGVFLGVALPSDDPELETSTVIGMVTPVGGGPQAGASVITRGSISQLILKGMGPPPAGRVYQAWVVRSNETVPTGALFSIPKSGDTKVSLPSLTGVRRVIVTAEGPQGSRTPTPPAVAVVVLPA